MEEAGVEDGGGRVGGEDEEDGGGKIEGESRV